MRFTAQYPRDDVAGSAAWARPSAVGAYARAAEASGFGAVAFTEHPAPPKTWPESGGHAAFDPFVALATCAAHTDRLRLMSFVAIADAAITELGQFAHEAGRDPDDITIQIKAPCSRVDASFDPAFHCDHLAELAAIGVTSFVVHPLAADPPEATSIIERYGATVVDRLSPVAT